MPTPNIAQKSPYAVDIKAGESYAWCACGQSKNQPFCDGSHKDSGFKPRMFSNEKDETVYLCGCKHTHNAPFCDGTHKTL